MICFVRRRIIFLIRTSTRNSLTAMTYVNWMLIHVLVFPRVHLYCKSKQFHLDSHSSSSWRSSMRWSSVLIETIGSMKIAIRRATCLEAVCSTLYSCCSFARLLHVKIAVVYRSLITPYYNCTWCYCFSSVLWRLLIIGLREVTRTIRWFLFVFFHHVNWK